MLEADVPFWSRRLLMKPGMTGWAQVRCGYSSDCETAAEKLSHDFWYLRHGNLAVDVAVCLRTLLVALGVFDPRPLWLRLRLRAARGHTR
jgi:lipopolysaccharide/colanic/teichoic acid biosynthesis glycosyltransferase